MAFPIPIRLCDREGNAGSGAELAALQRAMTTKGREEAMQVFRADFVRSSLGRLDDMEALLGRLAASPTDLESARALLGHFHGLSGAGGTYGFAGVTSLGQDGEASCRAVLSDHGSAAPADLLYWSNLVADLRRELSTGPSPEVSAASRVLPAKPPIDLLLVGGVPEDRDLLELLAVRDGMALRFAGSVENATQELTRRIPDGAIVNVDLPDGTGFEVVELLRGMPGGDGPAVLIVSGMGEFADRVDAIHCGADGFFLRPLDGGALMRRLEFLFQRAHVEAPRVLSVEDDPDQANFLTAVLESAGYAVRICGKPEHFFSEVAAFRPDLVLMDIQLPGASGYDLVRSLRQEETQAMVPVVFLTTLSELGSRIEAARAGGDDHMVKPVSPGLLLSTVAARIERARFLRTLLERDGLTRLLSHTAFLERARVAVARQQRHPDWNCAFVMLDIDRFKTVNDLYGHPAGDRVLATLAALLRRRLRLTDTIGRMGGEEFAILLEEFTEEQALRLMRRLLQEFSALEHTGPGGQSFRVTFSAGVAMLLAPRSDLKSWHQAADAALYAAKTGGRSRIVASSEGGG